MEGMALSADIPCSALLNRPVFLMVLGELPYWTTLDIFGLSWIVGTGVIRSFVTLKSEDFFNAEVYPEITFKSKYFDADILVGDLTISDKINEIILVVDFNRLAVDPHGQTKAGLKIIGTVNRKDFDLRWSAIAKAGTIVVSNTIKLVVYLQFVQE